MDKAEADRIAEYVAQDCHKVIVELLGGMASRPQLTQEDTLFAIEQMGEVVGACLLAYKLGAITDAHVMAYRGNAEALLKPHAETKPTPKIEIVPG